MRGFLLSLVPIFACSLAVAKSDCPEYRAALAEARQIQTVQKSIEDEARVKLEALDKQFTAIPALILKQEELNQAHELKKLELGLQDLRKLRKILKEVVDSNSMDAFKPYSVSLQFKEMGLYSSEDVELFYLGSPTEYKPREYFISVVTMLHKKSDEDLRLFFIERRVQLQQYGLKNLKIGLQEFDQRMRLFARLSKALASDGQCMMDEYSQLECSAIMIEPKITDQLKELVRVHEKYQSAQMEWWNQESRSISMTYFLEKNCKE